MIGVRINAIPIVTTMAINNHSIILCLPITHEEYNAIPIIIAQIFEEILVNASSPMAAPIILSVSNAVFPKAIAARIKMMEDSFPPHLLFHHQ